MLGRNGLAEGGEHEGRGDGAGEDRGGGNPYNAGC
jgi:hypothetical protein